MYMYMIQNVSTCEKQDTNPLNPLVRNTILVFINFSPFCLKNTKYSDSDFGVHLFSPKHILGIYKR